MTRSPRQQNWPKGYAGWTSSSGAPICRRSQCRGRVTGIALYFAACAIWFFSFSTPVMAQATQLSLSLLWDDGRPIHAQINLLQGTTSGNKVVASTSTSVTTSGAAKATLTYAFAASEIYYWNITCHAFPGSTQLAACPDGTLLASYPLMFIFIKPANLSQGEADLVFRKADLTLKTWKTCVGGGF